MLIFKRLRILQQLLGDNSVKQRAANGVFAACFMIGRSLNAGQLLWLSALLS